MIAEHVSNNGQAHSVREKSVLHLTETHRQQLYARGLTDKTIEDARLWSADATEVSRILGFNPKTAGLMIPYLDPVSGTVVLSRTRPDNPPYIEGKSLKYLHPLKAENHIYFPPGAASWIRNPTIALGITEGEFKTLWAYQAGLHYIGVSGVWNWRGRYHTGEKGPILDLELIVWRDRVVSITFDSDASTNPDVSKARESFIAELYRRGARVIYSLDLPPGANGEKVGLDDYLHAHGIDAFRALERQAQKIEQVTTCISYPELSEEALYGLAGDIVKAVDPFTEAAQVAVLVNILTMFGNVIDTNPYFLVERTKHFLRLFVALVGATSKGRKGQSLSTPRHMFHEVDQVWDENCITGGLSSGEGLIFAVRDPRHGIKDGKEVLIDQGVSDKRLLLIEEEFASALKVARRRGNTISAIIRQAWDKGNLRPLIKTNPIVATGAHISIIAHITKDELLRYLSDTEQSNGFANRFLWLFVKRSKLIPNPKGIPSEELQPLIVKLQQAVEFARTVQIMERDQETEELWEALYAELSEEKPGLLGAVTDRAESQVMRLACLYALLDRSNTVQKDHLKAAVALWEYSTESARLIFGDELGDGVADTIYNALVQNPEGLTRTAINVLFNRNRKASEIEQALGSLLEAGKVQRIEDGDKPGRPAERWLIVTKETKNTK